MDANTFVKMVGPIAQYLHRSIETECSGSISHLLNFCYATLPGGDKSGIELVIPTCTCNDHFLPPNLYWVEQLIDLSRHGDFGWVS